MVDRGAVGTAGLGAHVSMHVRACPCASVLAGSCGDSALDSEALEVQAVARLREAGRTLAVAESCTGGLIASRITDVAGASEVFVGGVVAYADAVKVALLGVSPATLEAHGAVSSKTSQEMAEGARELFQTDFALSVTGIAGPTGGTPEKPVGLVYVAVTHVDLTLVTRNVFQGDRASVRIQSVDKALQMLIEELR